MPTERVCCESTKAWTVSTLPIGRVSCPGRVTGAILAAGTLGSLFGTFGATHVLLGSIGAVLTVRCAGGLLLLSGLALLFHVQQARTEHP